MASSIQAPLRNHSQFFPHEYAVLLVDDDEDQLEHFKALLAIQGFRVFTTSRPREALALLRRMHIDIVISDLEMPGADGLEFIEYLRKNNPGTEKETLPIILLTSSYQATEAMALARGANLFCEKQEAEKKLVRQIKLLLQ